MKKIAVAVMLTAVVCSVLCQTNRTFDFATNPGDFSAFYSATVILQSDKPEKLYDQNLQAEIQHQAWPALEKRFSPFVYPPYFAKILSPLSRLSPNGAKITFVALMFFLSILSVQLMSSVSGQVRQNRLIVWLMLCAFAPVLIGISLGQNAMLSVFLYIVTIVAFTKNNRVGDLLAGITVGVWLFKPQFGILAAILLMLICIRSFRPWFVVGLASVGAGYFYLATDVLGLNWPTVWLREVAYWAVLDFVENASLKVSLIGVANALAAVAGAPLSELINAVGWTAAIFLFLFVAHATWQSPKCKENKNLGSVFYCLMLLGPTVVLVSPHTVYYDLGLCLVPILCLVDLKSKKDFWSLIGVILVAALVSMLSVPSALKLWFIFPILSFCFVVNVRQRVVKPLLSSETQV